MAGRQPIDPILPVPPVAGSLLQSVGAVPGPWQTGVIFESRAWVNYGWPDCVPVWEACHSETLNDKPVGASLPVPDDSEGVLDVQTLPACVLVAFDPFTVYTPVSDVSVQPDRATRLNAEARAAHEAILSRAIAAVLVGAPIVYGSTSEPFCVGDNDIDLPAAATVAEAGTWSPKQALALLLDNFAGVMLTTGGAMIHVPPAALPELISNGIVAQVGQRYVGPLGCIVIADAGYRSLGEATGTMYVSGPVEVSTGPEVVVDGSEFDDARLNQFSLIVEQRAIYRFDPRAVFSVAYTIGAAT